MAAVSFPDPARLADAHALAALTGPIRSLARSPLATVGTTGARHERLALTLESGEQRRLVLKRLRLSTDWTALRTEDRRGREAAMLAEGELAAMWDAIACPYLAFAADEDDVALLMDDLTPHLFRDVRESLADEEEERLLGALASLHARFWGSPALGSPWLARPEQHAGMLDARCAADAAARAVLPEPMREHVVRGWAAALEMAPPAVASMLRRPAAELAPLRSGLPSTLLHGDAKVANFALLPDGRVAAFDWALIGAGPATIDVGWYLAVNATRLARSKEQALSRYRTLLEPKLDSPLSDALWEALVRFGVVVGARMLLWSKALAVQADRPGARAEWTWWIERLEAACG